MGRKVSKTSSDKADSGLVVKRSGRKLKPSEIGDGVSIKCLGDDEAVKVKKEFHVVIDGFTYRAIKEMSLMRHEGRYQKLIRQILKDYVAKHYRN